jgi:hypothetical protein
MTFGTFARPMFIEPFGPLIGLADEWRAQGASEDEINMVGFDFDYVDRIRCCHVGPAGLPPKQLIEETDRFRIERDGLGRVMQLDKRTATIALPLDFPVKTMDDWLRLKPHYQYRADRIDPDHIAECHRWRENGAMVMANIPGAYDTLRNLMGEEMVAYACIDQPELVRDILDTLRETALQVLDEAARLVPIDQLSVHEDMAGKSGPMFGPAQMQEFVKPYFRPVWQMLSDRGTQIFDIDTDGNVNAIMDDLLDCGLNHMHPMEPAAGMDIVACRRRYGRAWTFNGGIDKVAIIKGPEAIDAELDYKLDAKLIKEGGIAFGLDHRIPNGTPLEHYRYYVRSARERLGLPPLDGVRKGWGRMAM